MDILVIVAMGWALALVTWVLYLAIMALMPHRKSLYPVARFHAYILLGVGLIFDVALNATVGSMLFLEPPHLKRLLLTARLSYHVANDHGWRTSLARWLCAHLLDQFDPNGKHCR